MPGTSKTISIKAPVSKIYNVVTDFEAYPDIFPEVLDAEVIKQGKKSAEVDFVFHIITKINCTLKFTLTPQKISWKLVKGDFMQDNVGSWDLKESKTSTKVTYNVEITPTRWVPSSMLESLITTNAPNMLKNLKKKCEQK